MEETRHRSPDSTSDTAQTSTEYLSSTDISPRDNDSLREGNSIGPYQLVRHLGSGAFGQVWLADRPGALATTQVALKLPRQATGLADLIRTEAQTWVRASGHPNIVPIIDAEIYGPHVVIASEYVSSGSLEDLIRSRAAVASDPAQACDLVMGILVALEFLHGRRILHRDLKPANVMIQEGIPRLTDFGLARELAQTTCSGMISGTPAYMAPEAFDGARTVSTDLWSVGVILYRLMTGELPFPQPTLRELLKALSANFPMDACRTVPQPLVGFLRQALAPVSEQRFRSAADMRAALVDCRRSLGVTPAKQANLCPYRSIAVTGSMAGSRDAIRRRLQEAMPPYASPSTTWFVGTWGVVDEQAVELLLQLDQRVMLVGYEAGDVSPRMTELIEAHDLTFVDPAGFLGDESNANEAQGAARNHYFITKADSLILIWDGQSPGTRVVLEELLRRKKDFSMAYF
ncbi:MAG: serine/threonine-protein kinase [Chloroflexi bacterium]|nr:serine/threonine-protein kinase [Chloroflexota bacterium]